MSFKPVDAFLDGIRRVHEQGWQPGKSTGWRNLDEFYTVRESEFTIVTGMPYHGKSEFMASMLVNLAKLHGWRFAIVSPEHQPIDRFICRLIEKHSQAMFSEFDSPKKITDEQLESSLVWIGRYFCFYDMPDDNLPLTRKVFEQLDAWEASNGKINGLLLDPYNEFDHSRTLIDARLSETEYISNFLSHLRRAARSRKLHLWLIAHPAKQQRCEDGTYSPVRLYDISGSAHFKNKCDNGLSIYRNDLEKRGDYMTVFVEKVKFREIGRMGEAYFRFDQMTGSYGEHKVKG